MGLRWGTSTFSLVVGWLTNVYRGGTAGVIRFLHLVSHHTGVPVVVVAAVAIVLSYRIIRRGARLAYEMVIALALVLLATKLGWIHW